MLLALLVVGLTVSAQTGSMLSGVVTDAVTGDTIYYPSVRYILPCRVRPKGITILCAKRA